MKPFLSGRPQVPASTLQPLADTGLPGAPRVAKHAHSPAQGPSASVECIKQGDRVTKLIVTCTCGERIEIDCQYPAGG